MRCCLAKKGKSDLYAETHCTVGAIEMQLCSRACCGSAILFSCFVSVLVLILRVVALFCFVLFRRGMGLESFPALILN